MATEVNISLTNNIDSQPARFLIICGRLILR
jgi:hypothetical protein